MRFINVALPGVPMTATVTSKGQVTLPKEVRDLLGVGPGSLIDFRRTADGSVVLLKVDKKEAASRFAKWRGSADAGLSTDLIMALTRGND
jgi:antitoxin PrlF